MVYLSLRAVGDGGVRVEEAGFFDEPQGFGVVIAAERKHRPFALEFDGFGVALFLNWWCSAIAGGRGVCRQWWFRVAILWGHYWKIQDSS